MFFRDKQDMNRLGYCKILASHDIILIQVKESQIWRSMWSCLFTLYCLNYHGTFYVENHKKMTKQEQFRVVVKQWHSITLPIQYARIVISSKYVKSITSFNTIISCTNYFVINNKRWTKYEQFRAIAGQWYPIIFC